MPIARVERALACLVLAFALGAGAAGAAAAELGTLFSTPEERERLDRMRRGETADVAFAPARPREITGYVKRSDGRNTVWVDGIAVTPTDPKGGATLDPRSVRAYADRDDAALKIERKPAR
jgi:hypothetical protein